MAIASQVPQLPYASGLGNLTRLKLGCFYGNSHQWASQYDGNNFGKIPETLHGCQEVQEITKRLFDALWYAS